MSPSDYLNVKRIRRKRRLFIVIAAPINRLCQNSDTHGDIVHLECDSITYLMFWNLGKSLCKNQILTNYPQKKKKFIANVNLYL